MSAKEIRVFCDSSLPSSQACFPKRDIDILSVENAIGASEMDVQVVVSFSRERETGNSCPCSEKRWVKDALPLCSVIDILDQSEWNFYGTVRRIFFVIRTITKGITY